MFTAGSGTTARPSIRRKAEIFSPPYLFKGARPSDQQRAQRCCRTARHFPLSTPDAATIASVSLIRPGAVTHSFDEDQRFLSLSFTAGTGMLTIQAPANANLAPPGYYMLFLVNNAGVPSVASFVRFAAPGGDTQPPSTPTNLSGQGAIGSATLTWTASTDNTGVALYNVHRATTSAFQPSPSNRIGQSTSTGITDVGVVGGSYFYVVTAQDVAGNVSAPSGEASVLRVRRHHRCRPWRSRRRRRWPASRDRSRSAPPPPMTSPSRASSFSSTVSRSVPNERRRHIR